MTMKARTSLVFTFLLAAALRLEAAKLGQGMYLDTAKNALLFGNDLIELRIDLASGSLKQVIDRPTGTVVMDAAREGRDAPAGRLYRDVDFQVNDSWIASSDKAPIEMFI